MADPRTTGEWICIVDRLGKGLEAREEMTVKVEYRDENIDKEGFKCYGVEMQEQPEPLC